jgi:uncharacterized membrane protein YuzA (DUF378 family)
MWFVVSPLSLGGLYFLVGIAGPWALLEACAMCSREASDFLSASGLLKAK